jgi:molybdopterin molybdotransferase
MKAFFKVTDLAEVLGLIPAFPPCDTEAVSIDQCYGRVLAEDVVSDTDLPNFARTTVDGYAVRAASTFGASEGNPGFFTVKGAVEMGRVPEFTIGPGEAAEISTGGMLPNGSDSVVMVEHVEPIDDLTVEVYRSVAPGQHVIEIGEDVQKDALVLTRGRRLPPQDVGMLAALGMKQVSVYRMPRVGIISTGDEIVSIDEPPGPGQIRDINTYTLSGLIRAAGGNPASFGIVKDDYQALFDVCTRALESSDMVMLSGGSSVGTRDYTVEVFSNLPNPELLVHGISISPGKPTILAKSGNKAIWGLPGHVVSAMVVFKMVVEPFIRRISGLSRPIAEKRTFPARLSRNLASAQGRIDYVRVRIIEEGGEIWAEPVLGKSGLIHTMIQADGLIEIGINTEGLDKGTQVDVIPL